ncbi:methyltransferase [Virgisporangium aliadipatigenens]|uniref:Methyltransferase n=1 Tax=Virgisporangium aliadipatigenens TaxID=741659 RepID=A0A8J4DNS2_9ACTN|nr:methyltransferase domain-containing protein [Virgisporangium aliadipatigenens]GIJ44739.1 methyltransferase [Virgisporangium aliadipatigenens]
MFPDGFAAALDAAVALGDRDPVQAVTALRAQGFAPEVAAAALTQASLRRRAVGKFGPLAASLFFTRTALEQATRWIVARHRAARLSSAGAHTVADLGCGIGADSLAFARAGLAVHAVEADPETAALARANLRGLPATVVVGDAAGFDLSTVDAVFADPARRTAGGRRVFSTEGLSPSWDFVISLHERVPRTVLKLAPGLDHGVIPPGFEAQWVSVGRDLVEACLWAPALARVPRRATIHTADDGVAELTGTGLIAAPVGAVRRYVFDPDGAVTRAGLVAEFAATVGGTIADPTIAFVYADAPVDTPFARCLEVVETLPLHVKRLRAALRERGIGRLEIRKRGSAQDVERLRKELKLAGPDGGVLLLTKVAGAGTAVLCKPVG